MNLSSPEFNDKLFNRRGFVIGTATIIGSTLFVDCSNQRAGSTTKQYTLALVQGLKDDPFYVTIQKGAQAMADKLGATLVVDGPTQFDAALQTPIVEALIVKRVDAIIIAACDKQAMIAPLQRANYAGIKIISVDTYIGDGDYVNGPVKFPLSYISSDNIQGGHIAGEALIKAMGNNGSIYIQNTKPGVSTTDQRELGCKEAITATNGAVTLVGVDYNNDNSTNAAQQTAAVLQRYKNLAGIFGTNLFGAEGAAQAIKIALCLLNRFKGPQGWDCASSRNLMRCIMHTPSLSNQQPRLGVFFLSVPRSRTFTSKPDKNC